MLATARPSRFSSRGSMHTVPPICVWKVPTWHEVKQADSPPIALHLSKSPDFEHFYDLLVSTLRFLQKYDRLADRIGADEKSFLDELQIVRVRMEQVSVSGEQLTADPPTNITDTRVKSSTMPSPLPTPPRDSSRNQLIKSQSFPVNQPETEPVRYVGPPQQPWRSRTSGPIPSSELVSLPY